MDYIKGTDGKKYKEIENGVVPKFVVYKKDQHGLDEMEIQRTKEKVNILFYVSGFLEEDI